MTQIIGEAEKDNNTILFQMFKNLEGRGKVKVWIMMMQKSVGRSFLKQKATESERKSILDGFSSRISVTEEKKL